MEWKECTVLVHASSISVYTRVNAANQYTPWESTKHMRHLPMVHALQCPIGKGVSVTKRPLLKLIAYRIYKPWVEGR